MANIVVINQDHPQPRKIEQMVKILDGGGVIAYPTDTVYGFGCDVHNKKAVDKVYKLKGVGKKHLMSFLCPDLSGISKYAQVTDKSYRILKRILPGPYTVILRATSMVPRILLPQRRTVGIRVPDSPIAHALLNRLGRPIISSSVKNKDGEPMLDPRAISNEFGNGLDAIIDGGFLGDVPSTVISLIDDTLEVIREGKGSLEPLGL